MELKFIGRGSAFNLEEGNNSAFYKNDKKQMLLIDCGESIFSTIKQKNILDGVDEVFVAITHTHSDHFGSLSSLALFVFFVLKQKVNLILTHNQKQNSLIKFMLSNMGVNDDWINYISAETFVSKMPEFKNFKFVESPHVAELDAFGIVFETENGVVYYSADTKSTKLLEKYLDFDNLDKIYMDTCLADYEGNVHVSLRKLLEVVPKEKRNKVYAMHIDNKNLFPLLKQHGFEVAQKI